MTDAEWADFERRMVAMMQRHATAYHLIMIRALAVVTWFVWFTVATIFFRIHLPFWQVLACNLGPTALNDAYGWFERRALRREADVMWDEARARGWLPPK